MQLVNLINIFVKNKNLSYSNLGKARSYSYDGLGNRMGIKEYERKIGYGEDGLKVILKENLSEMTPSYEESYILDRTRSYHNLLQRRTGKKAVRQYKAMFGTLMLHILMLKIRRIMLDYLLEVQLI